MPLYECAVVLVPSTVEEEISKQVDTVKGWITAIGGEISDVDMWGRRRLAYTIRKQLEGVYVLCYFSLDDGSRLPELTRRFNTAEFVLRHLVVRLPALKVIPRISAYAEREEKAREKAAETEKAAAEKTDAEATEPAPEPAEQQIELEAETPPPGSPALASLEPAPESETPAETENPPEDTVAAPVEPKADE